MRRSLAIPLALALVLIAGDTAAWFWATGRLMQYEAAWLAQRRADGWTVRSGVPVRSGWPIAAALVLPDAEVTVPAPDLPVPVTWRAGRAVLRVSLWNPYVLRIEPQGAQSVRLGDGPAVPYAARRLALTVPLDGSGSGDLLARDIVAGPGGGQSGGGQSGGIGLLSGHAQPGAAGWSVFVSAEAIGLPAGLDWALGPRISSVSAQAVLARTVSVQHFALGWGPLGVAGQATLGLDSAHRPEGRGVFRLVGYGAALDAAIAARSIEPGTALAIRAAFGLLAQASDAAAGDAAGDQVTVPLALREGLVSVAGVPVARVPALEGGEPP